MQTYQTQITDVIYNASTQCFEALVTLHDAGKARKYACAISAPITMSFQDAAMGLTQQAQRRHASRLGLSSHFTASRARPRAGRMGFDPVHWLESLINKEDRSAA